MDKPTDWRSGTRRIFSNEFKLHMVELASKPNANVAQLNRPGFPGECFICELRLPDHRFRWKHNKLFLLLPEEYGPAFPAIVDCYTSPP
ncbi:outer membrane usher protein FimD [Escherichia coli]|nr:outer membrane usher protein FimD [Escherichia coli]